MISLHLQYRALQWDPQTGESAAGLDAFSKYIISKVCKNLEEKSKYYLKDGGFVAQVRVQFGRCNYFDASAMAKSFLCFFSIIIFLDTGEASHIHDREHAFSARKVEGTKSTV